MAETFTTKLQKCYDDLSKSRVVLASEHDDDALAHFQKIVNLSLPQNENDFEMVRLVKSIFHVDMIAFKNVILQMPYLVLMLEARSIVQHFKVENIIFLKWNTDHYDVVPNKQLNERTSFKSKNYTNRNRSNGRNAPYEKRDTPDYREMMDRLTELELFAYKNQPVNVKPRFESRSNRSRGGKLKLETIEPDLNVTLEQETKTDDFPAITEKKSWADAE